MPILPKKGRPSGGEPESGPRCVKVRLCPVDKAGCARLRLLRPSRRRARHACPNNPALDDRDVSGGASPRRIRSGMPQT